MLTCENCKKEAYVDGYGYCSDCRKDARAKLDKLLRREEKRI